MSVLADIAYAVDPVAFATAAGFTPDPWQEDVLMSDAPRLLLNCSRQSGKSTTVALIAAHTALYKPPALVLAVAPTQRQSGELMRKVLDIYGAAGRPVDPEAESKLSLELENGSRIVALPGKEGTIRSYSGVALLLIDEASRVPDELLAAVRPMLAVSAGRLIALSTPWGRRGWWYDAWRARDEWAWWEVPATKCPRIPASFLEEEMRALGPLRFASEYKCEFVDPEGAMFRSDEVDRAFKEYPVWNLMDKLTFGKKK